MNLPEASLFGLMSFQNLLLDAMILLRELPPNLSLLSLLFLHADL